MMDYRMLGDSDLKISRIGFGTMSLEPDNHSAIHLLHQALDKGINYFDTADMYQKGLNEALLGKAFKGKRDQLILGTKVGNIWRPDGSGWDWKPSKKYILSEIENSLQRLQTDYIDLYQLHGGTLDDPIDEIIEAFEWLKMQGKIRYYGLSSIRPNVIREYVKKSSIVSVMMQYSLLDRRPEEEMLPFLQDHAIGVLARGTVAKGLLISKPPEPYLNYSSEQIGSASLKVKETSDQKRGPASTAIQIVLENKIIHAAIVGIRNKKHLEDALQSLESPIISSEELEMLKQSIPVNYYSEFR